MNKALTSLLAVSLMISANSFADSRVPISEELIGDYTILHETYTSSIPFGSGAVSGPGLGLYSSSIPVSPESRGEISGHYGGAALFVEFDDAPSSRSSFIGGPYYTELDPGVLEDGGRTLAMGVKDMGFGITLQRKVYIPSDNSFVRWLNIIKNTNEVGPVLDMNLVIEGNLNHYADVVDTSSGDSSEDTSDTWVVTTPDICGSSDSGLRCGPSSRAEYSPGLLLIHILNGTGDGIETELLDDIDFDGMAANWAYPLTLAPGETKIVMHFVAGFEESEIVSEEQYLALIQGLSDGDAPKALKYMSKKDFSNLSSHFPGTVGLGNGGGGDGSVCFIATAAYGTPMAQEIETLRDVRDTYMLNNVLGSAFVDTYYRLSPPIADKVAAHPALASAVRMVLTPFVLLGKLIMAAPMLLLSGLIAGAGLLLARRHAKGLVS